MKKKTSATKELTCAECGYVWTPRTAHPKACPRCLARGWDGSQHLTPKQLRQRYKESKSPAK